MMTMAVARSSRKSQNDQIRPEAPNVPDDVPQDLFAGPVHERFFRGLGEPEIDGAGEELFTSVDSPGREQLLSSNDPKFVALFAASTLVIVPAASSQTVKVNAVGSSAQWQVDAVAAANAPQLGGVNSHHYTIKGKCPSGANCGQIFDVRPGVNHAEGGNLWVVWNNAQTEVWAYLSTDSVVGIRAFFSQPRAQLQIDSGAETSGSAQNLISFALFKYGDTGNCGPGGVQESTCDAPALPAAIYNALKRARGNARAAGLSLYGMKTITARRSLWDADHIRPVAEGGGQCDLDNLRTLCLPCHREATAQLRLRLRRLSSPSPPLAPMSNAPGAP